MRQFISIRFNITCIFCLLFISSFSQKSELTNNRDSSDTAQLSKYSLLLLNFTETNKDSAFYYGNKAIVLAKKLNQKYYEGIISTNMAYNFLTSGDYTNALKFLIEATKLSENKDLSKNIAITPFIEDYLQVDAEKNRKELLGYIKNSLGILYHYTGSEDQRLKELLEAKHLVENVTNDMFLLAGITENIVAAYVSQNKFDSALYYQREAMGYRNKSSIDIYNGTGFATIGEIYRQQGKTDSAKKYLFEGINILDAQSENIISLAEAYISLANLYYDSNRPDSGIYYAKQALIKYSLAGTSIPERLDAYTALALNYNKSKGYDSAYKYMAIAKNISDSLNNIQLNNLGKFHSIGFAEKLRLKDLENQAVVTENRNRIILLLIVVIVFFVIASILYRNNKQKQRANLLLQQQKVKVESTLQELKSTQAQLIQSEKMASLGELTAGIAHEIQNPLNFVNNFSEVNKEMLIELNDEIEKGNYDDAKAIAKDVIANEEKINYHGKRADAIVKGMLQHSQKSSGQKELTDINALCDEYLRLSYHGLRAKDKEFNATINTDFDNSIDKINIIPQDIGRVLLNLYNNAFYAVEEKMNASTNSAGQSYQPTVSVSTKKINGNVEIKVKDNGNGIPPKIVDKIFQPFFTTKPTGQGTGLGLSLSYDIIKAHGSEIKVESKEGEGSEFVISLPAI